MLPSEADKYSSVQTWVAFDETVHLFLSRSLLIQGGKEADQHYSKESSQTWIEDNVENTNFGWNKNKEMWDYKKKIKFQFNASPQLKWKFSLKALAN